MNNKYNYGTVINNANWRVDIMFYRFNSDGSFIRCTNCEYIRKCCNKCGCGCGCGNNNGCGCRNNCGCCPCTLVTPSIPPVLTQRFCLTKVDSETGEPLAGAVFELVAPNGNCIVACSSDVNGTACFRVNPNMQYVLREVSPPAGYLPIDTVYNVMVDSCGRTFVDGVFEPAFVIGNTASAGTGTININYVSAETGLPIATSQTFIVAPGAYGPYSPILIPGYTFVGLIPGSDPVQGTIAAGQIINITFEYSMLVG